MVKKLGRTVRGPKTTKGIFCGQITARVESEIHRMLYNQALENNTTLARLAGDIITEVLRSKEHEQEEIPKTQIWTYSDHITRKSYTYIIFTNNMDGMEAGIGLYGKYQECVDVTDTEHKISDFINKCLEVNKEGPLTSCEFVMNEKNEKELKQYGV